MSTTRRNDESGSPHGAVRPDRGALVAALEAALPSEIASAHVLVSLVREGWLWQKHKKSEIDDIAERLLAEELKPPREG
jgi:hypothetical protein